jgi:hypothetical protein
MWMPPVTRIGRHAAIAANSTPLMPVACASTAHSQSAAPQRTPTAGKKQIA